MPKPVDDEPLKLTKEFREGRLSCRLFETRDRDGGLTTFFTLDRDGRKGNEPFIGGRNDLKRAKSLIVQAEKELSRDVSREWWPVVSAVKLVDGGAVCRVEKSFPDASKAERFAWKKPMAVFPRASDVEMQAGEELLVRYGDDPRLDRQIRQLRWREENKTADFAFGRWYDRGSMPSVGQRVNIEAVHDYQGEPRDHRISPLTRPVEPGEPQDALYSIIRRDPKIPGLGTVVGLTRIRRDAAATAEELQQGHDARMQASDERRWREEGLDPELRRFGPQREPEPSSPTVETPPPQVEAAPERTIVVGSLRAVVSEAKTDGVTRRNVRITRTKGGVEQHFDFDLAELLEVARQVDGVEKARTQVKEGLLETSHGRDVPGVEKPVERRDEARTKGGEEKSEGLRPSASTPHNEHWVAGVWHGAEPPKLNQPLWFATEAGRVQDRRMTPVQGEEKAPVSGERTRYVIGRVVGDGLAIVHGSTKDLDNALKGVGKLQREAEREQRGREADQSQRLHQRRRSGPSMGY